MTMQTDLPEGYWRNAQGALVPSENVSEQDKLEDELVRRIVAEAVALEDRLRLLKAMAMGDALAFRDLVAERYGAKKGGAKGNMTLSTYDGAMLMQISVADQIVLGLTRLEIDDETWLSAMDAIRDAIRVTSTKTYVRFAQRNPRTEEMVPVRLDLAKV